MIKLNLYFFIAFLSLSFFIKPFSAQEIQEAPRVTPEPIPNQPAEQSPLQSGNQETQAPLQNENRSEANLNEANSNQEEANTKSLESYYSQLVWNWGIEELFNLPIQDLKSLAQGQKYFFLVTRNPKGQILSISYYQIQKANSDEMQYKRIPYLYFGKRFYHSLYYFYSSDDKLIRKEFRDDKNHLLFKNELSYNENGDLFEILEYKKDSAGKWEKEKTLKYTWEGTALKSLEIFDGSDSQVEAYIFSKAIAAKDLSLHLKEAPYTKGVGNHYFNQEIIKEYHRYSKNKKIYAIKYEQKDNFIIPKKYDPYGVLVKQFAPILIEAVKESPQNQPVQDENLNTNQDMTAPQDMTTP